MPQIEYVTLAHHAEAINGLLYLQGAGWSEMEQPLDSDGNLGELIAGQQAGHSLLVEDLAGLREYQFRRQQDAVAPLRT